MCLIAATVSTFTTPAITTSAGTPSTGDKFIMNIHYSKDLNRH